MKSALKRLIILIAAELAVIAAVVWLADPFYQYHTPFFGLRAVLNDRENQMPGTIRNFQYDSLLVGSSVAENFDTDQLNAAYDCNTLKVIKASGSVADLLYYVELAEKEHTVENIFWCLDIFAMNASPEVQLYDNTPRYLGTETLLDDLPYLYNKEILLEKIPAMIVSSIKGINTGGQAYNWAAGKNFSAEGAMRWYDRPRNPGQDVAQKDPEPQAAEAVQENMKMLAAQIEEHPEIQYRFLIPPYSMLWWDCAWINGEEEERFYILEETIPMLLSFENVELYYFQNNRDIICNLDNYMDMIHYSPEINQYMLEQMQAGGCRLTEENREETMADMRSLVRAIREEEIYRYYER
ncbi:MAG: SGNH/GDSL hydrolase family protein [Butyrivibrio sp.]|nr:SGNH/GDSL hydrolase family protein [Acetatifactor muris]MCM1559893.1 SGNH/GDSL hydrolase family protein [Butyrivibrio sp.]